MIASAAVMDRVLEPVMTVEFAQRVAGMQADPVIQARVDELADKCNEGALSAAERDEYEAYVTAFEFVSILQAHARRMLKRHQVS